MIMKLQDELKAIEKEMNSPDFWNNKEAAQERIKRFQEVKDEISGVGKYDRGGAVMTLFAGAGGDDAEDFTNMLFEMYSKFISSRSWSSVVLHEHKNDHGGFRNITIEISGKNVYGDLKNESGVHRLVRISPFNKNSQRHTSFAMVEVVPVFEKVQEVEIEDDELRVEFSKSSGPGGQNVNKRETAVRIVHIPTNIAVSVESERSQAQNRQKAMDLLQAKIFAKQERDEKARLEGQFVSKTTENEWGSQIRSYVLHPYKMVKDHRYDVEVRDVEKVLDGDIEVFIKAGKLPQES
jgi:peptide chain release factor 2